MTKYVWKASIDFRVFKGEWDHARALCEQSITLIGQFKESISYADFEVEAMRWRGRREAKRGMRTTRIRRKQCVQPCL
jgi:hypothetical protein